MRICSGVLVGAPSLLGYSRQSLIFFKFDTGSSIILLFRQMRSEAS